MVRRFTEGLKGALLAFGVADFLLFALMFLSPMGQAFYESTSALAIVGSG